MVASTPRLNLDTRQRYASPQSLRMKTICKYQNSRVEKIREIKRRIIPGNDDKDFYKVMLREGKYQKSNREENSVFLRRKMYVFT